MILSLEYLKWGVLEVKLQNFCAGVPNGSPHQEMVESIISSLGLLKSEDYKG